MKKKAGVIIGSTVGALVLAIGVYQASADAKDPKLNTDETRKAVTEQYSDNTKNLQQEKEAMKAVYKAEVTDEKKQTALKLAAGKNNGDDNHDDNGNDSHDDNHDDSGNDSHDDNHDDNGNDSRDDNHDDNGNDSHDDNHDDNGNDNRDDNHDDNGSDSRDDDHDDNGSDSRDDKVNNTRDDDNGDDSRDDDHDDNGDDNNRNVQARELMSEKEIIAIAKKKFDGDVRSVEIDEDDGRTVYEIELSKGNKTEADFEIDAITGEILEMNIDTDNDDDDDNDDNDDNDDDDDNDD